MPRPIPLTQMMKKKHKIKKEKQTIVVREENIEILVSASLLVCLCLLYCLVPKVFLNQSGFLVVIMWPITIPTKKPLPYPITTYF